jgi:hypothetical protein
MEILIYLEHHILKFLIYGPVNLYSSTYLPDFEEASFTTGYRSVEFSYPTFGCAADRFVAMCILSQVL